jgi:hypothetical protein
MTTSPPPSDKKINFDDIDELLKCDVCKDTLYNAPTLICQHTFCESCIISLKECPMCRLKLYHPSKKNQLINDIVLILYGSEKTTELDNKNNKEKMEKELLPIVLKEMKTNFNKSILNNNEKDNQSSTPNLIQEPFQNHRRFKLMGFDIDINNMLKIVELGFLIYYIYGFYKIIKYGEFNWMKVSLNLIIIIQSFYSLAMQN